VQPAVDAACISPGLESQRSSSHARIPIHLLQVRTNSMKQLRCEAPSLAIIDSKARRSKNICF
jgi:hypothetical protein